MDALTIGNRLVELCEANESRKAIEELYADTVNVIEAMPMPGKPNGERSKEQILKDSDEFFEMMEIHGGSVDGPFPYADGFIVHMTMDCTPKTGPMAGNRMDMREACVYTVADGKITESQFCYHMPGFD
ncbi:MAG: nuclear transport factor 2 family protein [Planctomycetota bacterium]